MIFMTHLINVRSSLCGNQVPSSRSLVACKNNFGENSCLIKRSQSRSWFETVPELTVWRLGKARLHLVSNCTARCSVSSTKKCRNQKAKVGAPAPGATPLDPRVNAVGNWDSLRPFFFQELLSFSCSTPVHYLIIEVCHSELVSIQLYPGGQCLMSPA